MAWAEGGQDSAFYLGWRARWRLDGCPWFSQHTPPPPGWSGEQQLSRL